MINLRKSNERGEVNWDWLRAKHSFSFGTYLDPNWMGFRKLRVINEDRIAAKGGFDTHPHRDMEIMTFVMSGQLEHRDTMGNHAVIKPGEIQVMSAGTGIKHSEFNKSCSEEVHMLQIWIEPNQKCLKPNYEQFKYTAKDSELTLLASEAGGEGVATISQDINVSIGKFSGDHEIKLNIKKYYWIQIISGTALINKINLAAGDAVSFSAESILEIETAKNIEFLFFELD
jgi:redox-sensitive bicupin YhaK (pirin superfamily)